MKTHSILLPHLQENLFEPLAKVVHKAREDFDWEVILRALHFWEILFRLDEEVQVRMSNTFLNEIGTVLFGAIIDCDEPVRTKGQDFLRVVKLLLIDWDDIDVVSYEGSIDELKEFILQTKEKKKLLSFTNAFGDRFLPICDYLRRRQFDARAIFFL